jgi:hypothetical protein
MSDKTNRRASKSKPRCEICNGRFGLIRHRFARKQFCSKRCLERYLAKSRQQSNSGCASLELGLVMHEYPSAG